MKLEDNFNSFLIDAVNLNKSRFDTATTGINAVARFLESDKLFKDLLVHMTPQGSYRQKTIIKPASEELEFDVDLLFEIQVVDDWEPKDYLRNIANQFSKSDRYKSKVDTKGKSRCVTIDYDSDFHIDIVPAVRLGEEQFIMNKNTNQYEVTDGDGYAEWFRIKNLIANDFLIGATRLIKYIRDIKKTFTVRSILLTTLLGNQVFESDGEALYSDLPTSLRTLFNRLNSYLQVNTTMPEVRNPILPSESFNRHWDQEKYMNFREKIRVLNEKVDDAYLEEDKTESIKKWRLVFGNDFPDLEALDKASATNVTRDIGEEFLSDAKYKIPTNLQYSLKIDAIVEKDGFRPFNLIGARWPLRKLRSVKFYIQSNSVPEPFDIKWKVKNYGEESIIAGDRRGKIVADDGSKTKSERTKYNGSHYVECYVIKNDVCVAVDKIDVPIESI